MRADHYVHEGRVKKWREGRREGEGGRRDSSERGIESWAKKMRWGGGGRGKRSERGEREGERERERGRRAVCSLRLRLDRLILCGHLVEVAHDLVVRVAHDGATIVVTHVVHGLVSIAGTLALLVLKRETQSAPRVNNRKGVSRMPERTGS